MAKWPLFFYLWIRLIFAFPLREEIQVDPYSQLIYYIDIPESNQTCPLAIIIEGSYVDQLGPQSILRLHEKLADRFLNSGIGVVMMERRGVDGKRVHENQFHQFNTPSQRLSDHITLVQYLKNNPPVNWNGQFIVIGGSEGGPISIKLAHKIEPSACVAIVGCGNTTFKEYIWTTIESMQSSASPLGRFFMNWWYDLPKNRTEYDQKCEMMKGNPDPDKKWFGQTFLYWADALDQSESKEFLELKCPVIVVSGTKDIECSSTDKLIDTAKQNHQNISYLRIDGMDHDALNPKWHVLNTVISLLRAVSMN